MSFFQFSAALGGFIKANSVDGNKGLTREEEQALAAWLDEPPPWVH